MGFAANLVQGLRVCAWGAVPSLLQIALCFPSLALWPQPFKTFPTNCLHLQQSRQKGKTSRFRLYYISFSCRISLYKFSQDCIILLRHEQKHLKRKYLKGDLVSGSDDLSPDICIFPKIDTESKDLLIPSRWKVTKSTIASERLAKAVVVREFCIWWSWRTLVLNMYYKMEPEQHFSISRTHRGKASFGRRALRTQNVFLPQRSLKNCLFACNLSSWLRL